MKHRVFSRIVSIVSILLTSFAPVLLGGGVVTDVNDSSLRTALAGGGTVTFSTSGTVLLTNTLSITSDTVIDGAGQGVSISGNNLFRVFQVSPGVNFTLLNVSVIHGRANEGAGVFNDGGSVTVSNCLFAGNIASGLPGTNGFDTNAASSGMPGNGGAVYSMGSLIAAGSTFLTNRAVGGSGGSVSMDSFVRPGKGAPGRGGAIFASAFLGITNCAFTSNSAEGGLGGSSMVGPLIPGESGGEGMGGAIYTKGTLNASNSQFSSNLCIGGNGGKYPSSCGGQGGNSSGGALCCTWGSMSLVDCSFDGNSAKSGYGFAKEYLRRGITQGGAICSLTSTVTIVSCRLSNNAATGVPAFGGGLSQKGGTLMISRSSMTGNSAATDVCSMYYDWDGVPAWGGGLYNDADAVISDSIFATNRLEGGATTKNFDTAIKAGPAYGAGLCSVGSMQLYRCTVVGNLALGGLSQGIWYAPLGGDAKGGGAYFATNAAGLVNCTFAANSAQGGATTWDEHFAGWDEYAGNAFGGGLYTCSSAVSLTNCTLAGNQAIPGIGWTNSLNGEAYGDNVAVETGSIQVMNTILSAGVSSNAFGNITDLGHNISSDTSCAFSAPGSINNANPKLLPLANNGGFTPTMALLPDSPAIDNAAAVAGVDVDQRGVTRPYGTAPDIGAYEWNATSCETKFTLSLGRSNANWTLALFGPPLTTVRVQRSADLAFWSDISTNTSSANGTVLVEDTQSAGPRYYRTVSPE